LIQVDIRSNIDLVPACDYKITLAGLMHALTPTANVEMSTLNGTGSIVGTGEWSQSVGTLVFSPTATVNRNILYSFGFVLINPQKNIEPLAEIRIQASTKNSLSVTARREVRSQDMVESAQNAPDAIYKSATDYSGNKEAWPLNVRNLVFEIKTIQQSTPHAGCRNSITVSLQTNVPLIPSAFCQPVVTISGFTSANQTSGKIGLVAQAGSCPDGSNAAFVFKDRDDGLPAFGTWVNGTVNCLGGPSADPRSSCLGGSGSGFLEIWSAARTAPGQPYSFSFYIQNPLAAKGTGIPEQESPDIKIRSLRGTSNGNYTVGNTKLGVPSSEESMVKSQAQPCCLCNVQEGDASPMVVKNPGNLCRWSTNFIRQLCSHFALYL